ncbi:MAG: ABC transporter ATP-binding protein, partial [Nitrososphaerota archaeon]|nr:ABC transporter ATP-binding protein [Nitrososphaerota archaeon]
MASLDEQGVVLEISDLSVNFSNKELTLNAVNSFSLSLRKHGFVTIVGPSGCGKTTILRCICGLQKPTSGRIHPIRNQTSKPNNGMTIVFQDYSRSLFPWRTILSNVMFPLEGKVKKKEASAKAMKLLEQVGLKQFWNYYPWQISGGMQQRVAIARSLAPDPDILLMDEPFASVDAQTRSMLEDQLLELWNSIGLTVLLVTHDIDEAVYLSEDVIVLSDRPSHILDKVHVELPYP